MGQPRHGRRGVRRRLSAEALHLPDLQAEVEDLEHLLVRGDFRPDGAEHLHRWRTALQDVAGLTAQEVAHTATETGHGASMRAS